MKKFFAVLVVMGAAAWFAVPAFATADPNGGYLEICKTSSTLTSGVFAFQVTSNNEVTADAVEGRTIYVNVGECSPELYVGTGSVTVHEINYTDENGFNTDDYTEVTSIHTVAPGAPDQQLGDFNLDGRWADVTINGGGPSQGTTVKFNDELVQGYYEICKTQVAGAGLDGQSFHFDVEGANGYAASLDIPVGGCSFPQYAPAGHVNIQEDKGTFTYVDTQLDPTDHTAGISSSTDDLIDYSISGAWAVLAVRPAALGDTSDESIVTFRNNSSLVKVCKVVPTESGLQNSVYQFNVDGVVYSVHSFSFYDPGHVFGCVLVNKSYRTGTSTTITEAPQAGQALDHIWLTPDNATAVTGGTDFTGRSVTFDVQSGMNEVFFLNVPVAPQLLKICKTGGAAGGSVAYEVKGWQGEAPDLTAGDVKLSVPLDASGAGCAEAAMWAFIGPVTVTETIPAGSSVTAITANGSDDNGNRLKQLRPRDRHCGRVDRRRDDDRQLHERCRGGCPADRRLERQLGRRQQHLVERSLGGCGGHGQHGQQQRSDQGDPGQVGQGRCDRFGCVGPHRDDQQGPLRRRAHRRHGQDGADPPDAHRREPSGSQDADALRRHEQVRACGQPPARDQVHAVRVAL